MDYKDQIIDILVNFDFEKVHKHMVQVHWTYYMDGEKKVPEITDLKKAAKELLEEAANEGREYFYVASGGFRAFKFGSTLELTFELTSWSACY